MFRGEPEGLIKRDCIERCVQPEMLQPRGCGISAYPLHQLPADTLSGKLWGYKDGAEFVGSGVKTSITDQSAIPFSCVRGVVLKADPVIFDIFAANPGFDLPGRVRLLAEYSHRSGMETPDRFGFIDQSFSDNHLDH